MMKIKFIERIKEYFKQERTTTLTHFDVKFKTSDGEFHKYTNLRWIDEYNIDCNGLDFYLQQRGDSLIDDNKTVYPINNIISIKAINIKTIENAKVIYDKWLGEYIRRTYYSDDEIEIISKEEL